MKNLYVSLVFLFCLKSGLSQVGFQENIVTGDSYSTLQPENAQAVDVDGDNDLDIIVSGRGVNWYENIDGLGHFGEKNIIAERSGTNNGSPIITADFDNDGDIDVLNSRRSPGSFTLYGNVDGFGTFQIMQVFDIPDSFNTILLEKADFNNDGSMDIVGLYRTNGGWRLAWYDNDGLGNFNTERIITTTGLNTASYLIIDDIDGDGDGDIILGHRNADKITYLRNVDGANSVFEDAVNVTTTADGIRGLFLQDIDADGDIDIVATTQNENQVLWYENLDGLGGFSNEVIISSNVTGAYSVFISDIDLNGSQDIIYAASNEIKWQENDGVGGFGVENSITDKVYDTRHVIVADMDGDGYGDVVSTSYDDDKVAWYKNTDGQGNFGRQLTIARRVEFPDDVYPADFDGDGDIDLLTNSQHDGKLSWLENVNGIGFFGIQHIVTENVGSGSQTPFAYPVDIDGDNDIDIAVSQQSILKWYENVDGQGTFSTEHIINDQGLGATLVRSADVDSDGDMDLIYGLYSRNKIFWHENLNGAFGPEQVIYDSGGDNGSLTSLEIADFNGDSHFDIVASSFNTDMFLYYNMDGQGNFQDQNMLVFDRMQAVYPVDIDGDGDNDIVGVDNNGGGVFDAVVWYRNDNGVFNTQFDVSTLQIHGKSIHAIDVDNDGDMDVLTASGHPQTSGKLSWYENVNGNGTFAERQVIHELFNFSTANYVNAADIDNDGNKDILVTYGYGPNNSVSKVSVFKNLGQLGNMINGTVRLDGDTNGCDINDNGINSFMISSSSSSSTFALYPEPNGNYQLLINEGDLTTEIVNLPSYFTATPVSYVTDFNGLNNTEIADFCIEPLANIDDLNVYVFPILDNPRPGFDTAYQIVYNNMGTSQLSGDITFQFDDSKIQFLSASEDVDSQTANTVTFNYSNLNPLETRTLDLTFNVFPPPTTLINDILVSTVTINPISGDNSQDDNVFELEQVVIGSYDPNDITCLQGDAIFIEDADKYLNYLIRFQNTGTASAINVRVEHILDSKLDWTTMQLQSLSHSGRVEITDGTNVQFIFDNINLPDSTTDEEGSNGYIAFKIKPKQDVVVGDVISGVADIYFDFNPPIITNTAITEIVEPLSVDAFEDQRFQMYPNPAEDKLNISSSKVFNTIALYDFNGRMLLSETINAKTHQLDVSALSTGIYFLEIQYGSSKLTEKFIKN